MKWGILLISTVLINSLSASGPSSFAFEVNETGQGAEIKWDTSEVRYRINTSNGPSGNRSAIEASLQTWTDVQTSSFAFIFDGTTNSTAYGEDDGTNIIGFGSLGVSGTLAQNTFWYFTSSGHIIDSDIEINTDYTWATDGSSDAYDVQNTVTHELGHSLSLADLYEDEDSKKTMYYSTSIGETKKRTLHQDDRDGITYLYPSSDFPWVMFYPAFIKAQ